MSTRVTVYEEGKKTEGNYSLSDAHAASREDPPAVVWISLVEPSKEELDSVAQHFGPQELEQEDTETRKGVILRYQGRRLTLMVSPAQGADRFEGRQLHTKDYRTAGEFAGRNVIVVGGGISAIQLLDEVSRVTTTTWLTRRPPEFREGPFTEDRGRAAVALVEDRVRSGLPPRSVVSVTGLPVTPAIEAMRARGVLDRLPMFSEILEDGVRWPDGTVVRADVILWCTGFRSSLDHVAPLMLREPGGGITMTGRLATQVAKEPRVHLVGYGPSASTIGANRAGAAAARELMAYLGEEKR